MDHNIDSTGFSKKHRNTFSTYGIKQAFNAIQKVEIIKMEDLCSRLNERTYDLNKFGDQLLLYSQH